MSNEKMPTIDMSQIIKDNAKNIESLHATYHAVLEQKMSGSGFENKEAVVEIETAIFNFCDFWVTDGDTDNWVTMHNALCYGLMGNDEGTFELMVSSNDLALNMYKSIKYKFDDLSEADQYWFMD